MSTLRVVAKLYAMRLKIFTKKNMILHTLRTSKKWWQKIGPMQRPHDLWTVLILARHSIFRKIDNLKNGPQIIKREKKILHMGSNKFTTIISVLV